MRKTINPTPSPEVESGSEASDESRTLKGLTTKHLGGEARYKRDGDRGLSD